MPQEPRNLEQLLDRLQNACDGSREVAIGDLLETVGRRSFGPLLLVAGVIGVSPLAGVPGVPTLIALIVVLIAGQLLLQRQSIWLPGWVTRRKFTQSKLDKTLRFMRPIARWTDKLIRPRLTVLTQGWFVYVIAVICLLVAVSMPPLELIPFANTATAAAITAFGLALIAHDGLLAGIGVVLFVGGVLSLGTFAL